MSTLVALDPGRNYTGVAVFEDNELRACGLSVLPKTARMTADVCHAHYQHTACLVPYPRRECTVVVEEMCLSLARERTPREIVAKANDLIVLTAVGAYVAGRLGAQIQYIGHAVQPKEVTKAQVLYFLSEKERAVVESALGKRMGQKIGLNVFDALRHGLAVCGRLGWSL